MHAQPREHPPRDFGEADILDDHGIHARGVQRLQFRHRIGQFIGEHQNIQGDIPLHPVAVQEGHDFGKFPFSEIVRAHPGIETLEPEENGIRAVRHRRPEAIPIARRGEEFGFFQVQGRRR